MLNFYKSNKKYHFLNTMNNGQDTRKADSRLPLLPVNSRLSR
jgi:hypothetical protein